ncbi:MAG: PAS domain-containing protein [Anaerolineaceae bacterium]|nr:PAS domain-containing protein [Anaerolineaceae bacterium]
MGFDAFQMISNLPIACFAIDQSLELTHVNDPFLRLFGFETPDQVLGQSFSRLLMSVDQVNGLLDQSIFESTRASTVYQFSRADGTSFFGRVTWQSLTDGDQTFVGTIQDSTFSDSLTKFIEEIPAGIYEAQLVNGEVVLVYCNQEFASALGYSKMEDLLRKPIRELYFSEAEYEHFEERFHEKCRNSSELMITEEELRTAKGHRIGVQVKVRPEFDSLGNLVGRYGVILPDPDEKEMKSKLEDLTTDIGRVLHSYSTTLTRINLYTDPLKKYLGASPFVDENKRIESHNVEAEVQDNISALKASIRELLGTIHADWAERGISPLRWRQLNVFYRRLEQYQTIVKEVPMRIPYLATVSERLMDLMAAYNQKNVPREMTRMVSRNAQELLRIILISYLHEIRLDCLDMDLQTRSLRDFVSSGIRIQEKPEPLVVWDLVQETMGNLSQFAETKEVEFQTRNDLDHITILGERREVLRALTNLLHNAIKYSWNRPSRKPYVTISAYLGWFENKENVVVAFENYGVPIHQDEIDKDLIFHVGYRGRSAGDRGRLGTGIGLKDARKTARSMGGEITAESHPAWSSPSADDLDVPYITTVAIRIPTYRE